MKQALRSPSLICAIVLWAAIVMGSWGQNRGSMFAWDAFGYHLYLPAAFIEKDLLLQDLQWVEEARSRWASSPTLYQISHFPDGSRVIKYPMGLAVLWSPWFAIGHVWATLSDHDADGYSMPYQRTVQVGILTYLLLGFLAIRKVLTTRFSEPVTCITLFLLVLGTNLLDQSIHALSMPHVLLFALYGGILYSTVKWSESGRVEHAASLAVLMGLATLVRPTEAICVLIPLLWSSTGGSGTLWSRIRQRRKQWFVIGAIMFLVGLPQFTYWFAATGSFIIDSYNNPGEGLDLLSPHTGPFLLGFRKGWYIYTPLMLLATVGIFHLRKHWREAFLPIAIYFVLNLYLVSSWTNWWYADSFGSRAMVGSYAVMALPLAGLLRTAGSWLLVPRLGLAVLLSGLVLLNIFQHLQYKRGIIHTSRMTAAAYRAAFGQLRPVEGMNDLLLVDRSGPADVLPVDMKDYKRKSLDPELLLTSPTGMDTLIQEPTGEGNSKVYRIGREWAFSPAIRIPFKEITKADHVWVELTWRLMPLGLPSRGFLVTTMEHRGRSYGYVAKAIEREDLIAGEWNTIITVYRTPEIRNTKDLFLAYYWAHDTLPLLVDGPYLQVLEPATFR